MPNPATNPPNGHHRRGDRRAPAWLPLLRRPRRRGCLTRIVQWVALFLAVASTATALLGASPVVAALAALAAAVVGAVTGAVIVR